MIILCKLFLVNTMILEDSKIWKSSQNLKSPGKIFLIVGMYINYNVLMILYSFSRYYKMIARPVWSSMA